MRRSPLALFSSPRSVALRGHLLLRLLILTVLCLPPQLAPAQAPVKTGGTAGGQSAPGRLPADATNSASPNTVVADPYLVFVAEEAAYLRCGPAGEYYRTDPLRHGQELEVYVETDDGWLGVRPTADSFCWIPADTARLLPAGDAAKNGRADALEAEITEDKTVAWIGTNLGRARRYRWQVQLGEGEIITILGRSEREGPDGPQTWYRIVPPSGEFRWIHSDQVATTAEDLLAAVKQTGGERPIEFLPGGPSHLSANTAQPSSGLRRVSDDHPYQEEPEGPQDAPHNREQSIAEIRRLDEIERNIEARSRSRFERLSDQPGEELAHANDHPTRSFSQRVTDGLSALVNGRKPQSVELEPLTTSSRRLPDLVPIGSGLAAHVVASETPAPAATELGNGTLSPANKLATEQLPGNASEAANPSASPSPKTVAAAEQPGLRSDASQVAIMSAPRVVAQTPSPLSPLGNLAGAPGNLPGAPAPEFIPPAKMRTIEAAQLQEVQRAVAEATPQSLPLIMSSLMARGASAPEIRLVADAAQAFSLNELAQRARDYEALARRRDGDTVVATSTLAGPIPLPVNPQPAHPLPTGPLPTGPLPTGPLLTGMPPATPSSVSPEPARESFVARGTSHTAAGPNLPAPHSGSPPLPIEPVNYLEPSPGMPDSAATAEQAGVLVEVYSADPDRPPYAITDRAGQTLAYVTPAPGVELRKHLGSEIQIRGERGFLPGLNTPHVLATAAERMLR